MSIPPLRGGTIKYKNRSGDSNRATRYFHIPSFRPSGPEQQTMKVGSTGFIDHFHINSHLTPLWGARQQIMKVDRVTPRSYPALSYKNTFNRIKQTRLCSSLLNKAVKYSCISLQLRITKDSHCKQNTKRLFLFRIINQTFSIHPADLRQRPEINFF